MAQTARTTENVTPTSDLEPGDHVVTAGMDNHETPAKIAGRVVHVDEDAGRVMVNAGVFYTVVYPEDGLFEGTACWEEAELEPYELLGIEHHDRLVWEVDKYEIGPRDESRYIDTVATCHSEEDAIAFIKEVSDGEFIYGMNVRPVREPGQATWPEWAR
jgi:hypothetical protein